MKNIIIASLAIIAMSTPTFAGGDLIPENSNSITDVGLESKGHGYLGIGYSSISLEIETDRTYDAVNIIAGYKFHEYFSTELRYNYGVESDNDLKVENIALYLKPQYALNDNFEVYGLLGYGKISARQTSDSGFQFGLGAEYFVNDKISIFADYTTLYDDVLEEVSNLPNNNHESTISSINIGVNYHF